jgi:hypothetical protein
MPSSNISAPISSKTSCGRKFERLKKYNLDNESEYLFVYLILFLFKALDARLKLKLSISSENGNDLNFF